LRRSLLEFADVLSHDRESAYHLASSRRL
jgi:hypothetical protein